MGSDGHHSGHGPSSKRPWYSMDSQCIYCGSDEFHAGWGPFTLVMCSACIAGGTHVGCYEGATGMTMTEDVLSCGSTWFCSEECHQAHQYLESKSSSRLQLKGTSNQGYSLELLKYDAQDRSSRSTVDTALKILKASFDPLIMDNGKDLLEMVVTGYETPDEEMDEDVEAFNFSGFRMAVLRKGPAVVSVATVRVFGRALAEVPFVATRDGYRGEGNCRRLMQALEELLRGMKVQWMVLPSIRSLLTMWRHKFRFQPLTLEEQHHLEPHIVSPDFDSAQLVKKQLCDEDGTPVAHGGRALGCSGRGGTRSTRSAPTTRGKRRGRSVDASGSSEEEDEDWGCRDRKGGSRGRRVRAKRPASSSRKGGRGGARRSAADSSSSSSSEESSEEASGREYCPSGGDKSDTPSDDEEGLQPSPDRKKYRGSSSATAAAGAAGPPRCPSLPNQHGQPVTAVHIPAAAAPTPPRASASSAPAPVSPPAAAPLSPEEAAAVAAAEAAAMKRLVRFLDSLGAGVPPGWHVQIYRRLERGKMTNRSKFVAPDGVRSYGSVNAVARALGLQVPEPGGMPAGLPGAAGSDQPPTATALPSIHPRPTPFRATPAAPWAAAARAASSSAPPPPCKPRTQEQRRVARAWRESRRDLLLGYTLADAVQDFYRAAVEELQGAEAKSSVISRLEADKQQMAATIAALAQQVAQLQAANQQPQQQQQQKQREQPESGAAAPEAAAQAEPPDYSSPMLQDDMMAAAADLPLEVQQQKQLADHQEQLQSVEWPAANTAADLDTDAMMVPGQQNPATTSSTSAPAAAAPPVLPAPAAGMDPLTLAAAPLQPPHCQEQQRVQDQGMQQLPVHVQPGNSNQDQLRAKHQQQAAAGTGSFEDTHSQPTSAPTVPAGTAAPLPADAPAQIGAFPAALDLQQVAGGAVGSPAAPSSPSSAGAPLPQPPAVALGQQHPRPPSATSSSSPAGLYPAAAAAESGVSVVPGGVTLPGAVADKVLPVSDTTPPAAAGLGSASAGAAPAAGEPPAAPSQQAHLYDEFEELCMLEEEQDLWLPPARDLPPRQHHSDQQQKRSEQLPLLQQRLPHRRPAGGTRLRPLNRARSRSPSKPSSRFRDEPAAAAAAAAAAPAGATSAPGWGPPSAAGLAGSSSCPAPLPPPMAPRGVGGGISLCLLPFGMAASAAGGLVSQQTHPLATSAAPTAALPGGLSPVAGATGTQAHLETTLVTPTAPSAAGATPPATDDPQLCDQGDSPVAGAAAVGAANRRLSDSFLGELLPGVVGVIMPTPEQQAAAVAATAGVSPGDMHTVRGTAAGDAAAGCQLPFDMAAPTTRRQPMVWAGSPPGGDSSGLLGQAVDAGVHVTTAGTTGQLPGAGPRPGGVQGQGAAPSTSAAAAAAAAVTNSGMDEALGITTAAALAAASSKEAGGARAATAAAGASSRPRRPPALAVVDGPHQPAHSRLQAGVAPAAASAAATAEEGLSSSPGDDTTPSPPAAASGGGGQGGCSLVAACFGEVLQLYSSHMLSPTQSPGDGSDSGDGYGDLGAADGAQLQVSPPEVATGAAGNAFARLQQLGRGGRVGSGGSGSSPEGEVDLDQVYEKISTAMREDGFLPAGKPGSSGSGGRMREGSRSRGGKQAATAAAAAGASGFSGRRRIVAVAHVAESEGVHTRPSTTASSGAAQGSPKAAAAAAGGGGCGTASVAAAGIARETMMGVGERARAAPLHRQLEDGATPPPAPPPTTAPGVGAGAAGVPSVAAGSAAAAAGVARRGPGSPGSPTPTTDMDWLGLDQDSALQQVAVFAWPDLH